VTDDFRTSLTAAIDTLICAYTAQETAEAEGVAGDPFVGEALDHSKLKPIGLDEIRKHDPAFTLVGFLEYVGEMFATYHEAFDRGDPTPLRRFAIDPVLSSADEAFRKAGPTSVPRTYLITAIHPEVALREDEFDLIRVMISARRVTEGTMVDPLRERWRLVRVRGAQTHAEADLAHCPTCGAPDNGDDPAVCAYCGAHLADPESGWVVREIDPL
jgi:predicted lipid-binding transport protein (Tim44 family)